ncbi:C40 family peptidase [Herbidospora yilanensis]|uniref:C40 family peptidase n=1 Tax=Herbidospora yilanensis TaxID=354426 RepID=UPI0007854C64|nr:NlpC/P60 family protein [Herbidospora yilanensis]
MLTTLLTAILCTPHPGAEARPCPSPASFRYVHHTPTGLSDDPDELDELIDLAELAERWGHTWPPPEWGGFDPWAADGPWAEAWDDFDDPEETMGGVFGPSDRDLRPGFGAWAGALAGGVAPGWGARPLQDGWPVPDGRARPLGENEPVGDRGAGSPQEAGTAAGGGTRPLQDGGVIAEGGARPRQDGGAVVDGGARPLQDGGAALDGGARPGQDGVVTLDGASQEGAASEGGSRPGSAGADRKPKSDDRRPRGRSEEPPGVEAEPRKKRKDREPRKPEDENTTTRDATPGAVALRAATKWLGIPYVWGGGNAEGPSRGIGKGANRVGFDCSGLTLAAWAKAGVTLGHYTGTQIKQGKPVQTKDLLPGDLLFFGATKTDPSHVGLYAGDGDMIHAPRTGDVVKRVEVLAAPVWMKRFQGAVRPQLPSAKT